MRVRALALALTISIPFAAAYHGDLTYYTPATNAAGSSCDIAAAPGENIVAISHLKMNNGANPNNNPLCGTTISIYNPQGGNTVSGVKIVDTCMGCDEESIDVNPELFQQLGFELAQGRVTVDWGGNSVGGKKRSLEVEGVGKRELRHPHGRGEAA